MALLDVCKLSLTGLNANNECNLPLGKPDFSLPGELGVPKFTVPNNFDVSIMNDN